MIGVSYDYACRSGCGHWHDGTRQVQLISVQYVDGEWIAVVLQDGEILRMPAEGLNEWSDKTPDHFKS